MSEIDSRSGSLEGAPWPACDIFNTTFSLYRASPLFVGPDGLSESRLRVLEAQLLDILTGESVRGVDFGLHEDGDSSMGSAGILETITIEWASADRFVATSRPALQAILQYENAQCMAILLPTPEVSGTTKGATADPGDTFLSLPILLFRMPASLKVTMARFLSSAFDSRITPLHLSSSDIVRSWESWAYATALPTNGPLARDVVLTLAFNLLELRDVADPREHRIPTYAARPASPKTSTAVTAASSQVGDPMNIGLRTVDVSIPNRDLGEFLKAGQQLESDDNKRGTPFITALAYYFKGHLGLDLSNSAVEVVRVACGGFVLSINRIKIFDFPESVSSAALYKHRSVIPRILGDFAMRSPASA
ncbi:Bifunctional dehydrogenase and ferrochelatase [Sporothrix epigloea]|uniref:Bifunctional dehydrogenase and ferrochelatase n=1 Tax=Sporothrix epigloea TaxID=1892477 RepID=A0ABP0DBV2_9PEZI